jgi:hypothetical protein
VNLRYEIRVKGILDGRRTAWFEDLQVSSDREDTVIVGPVADQAALHGLLTKVGDLGLFLISVRHLDPDRPSRVAGRPVIMRQLAARSAGNTDQKHRSSPQGE